MDTCTSKNAYHILLDNSKVHTSEKMLSDLEIHSKLLHKIDHTITKYGYAMLKHQLNSIYVQDSDLQNAQNQLKCLTNSDNQNILIELEAHLRAIENLEFTRRVWSYQFLNCYYHEKVPEPVLNFINQVQLFKFILMLFITTWVYMFYCHIGLCSNITGYFKYLIESSKLMVGFFLSFVFRKDSIIHYISVLVAVFYTCFNLYNTYQAALGTLSDYKQCQESIIIYYKMVTLIHHCKTIREIIEQRISATNFIKDSIKEHCFNLNINTEILDKSFTNLDNYFIIQSNLGHMINTCRHYREYSVDLDNILNYIGHIDALISNSKLLTKGYTLPAFIYDTKEPSISINMLFHPLLKVYNVKNDFVIGTSDNVVHPLNTMIITGPNKAGKSTYLKSVMLAVYLAQSLGVSCCKSIQLTPFKQLYTYLNIPDSLGHESLFEAELNRCLEYYRQAKSSSDETNTNTNTNTNTKIFGIFDELMTGTNFAEGMSCSYGLIKNLTKCKQALTVITTHYHEICDLEHIAYYQFQGIKNTNTSKYQFNYQIQPGISSACIALDLLAEQENLDTNVILDARKKLIDYQSII